MQNEKTNTTSPGGNPSDPVTGRPVLKARCSSGYEPTDKDSEIQTGIPFAQRRLNLGAIPDTGTPITNIDLDLTVACNLRCTYCFKEKWNEHMEERVAFDAVLWLLYASGAAKEVNVNFMGGEPLMRFQLIKQLVPFGKRRAWQMQKSIHFGMTTNGTLVTDTVVDFWRKWGLGFHTSIDGVPEIQDRNRPMRSGQGSSRLVEKAVPKILGYRPHTTARCTILPDGAGRVVENYKYFRSLGYVSIAMVPGGPPLWTQEALDLYEKQFTEVGNLLIEEFRAGRFINLKGVDETIQGIVRNERTRHACGAGRGMALVDIHGDIWPCHRWNKASEGIWRIGNIYEQFNDIARVDLDREQVGLLEHDCEKCIAKYICSGGCPAENLEETGKVYRRHENSCKLSCIWAKVGYYVHDILKKEQNPVLLKHYYQPKEAPAKTSKTA